MASENDNLRALIRMLPPARALRQELKAVIAAETFEGVGKLAVRNFTGLLNSVISLTDDGAYLETLAVEPPGNGATADKEQVMAVLFSLSQLIAYLEGQIGLPAAGGEETGKDMRNYNTSDNRVTVDFSGAEFQIAPDKSPVDPDAVAKLIGGERGQKVADMLRSVFAARAGKQDRNEDGEVEDDEEKNE
ncbi:MAG TPA: hypothetical protein PLE60_04680 [Candidatus Latescibacteria bacterium]|nr:hypothetical protein [Candidatus Latescibacterota bacterium]